MYLISSRKLCHNILLYLFFWGGSLSLSLSCLYSCLDIPNERKTEMESESEFLAYFVCSQGGM
jgi:hypothetical protein